MFTVERFRIHFNHKVWTGCCEPSCFLQRLHVRRNSAAPQSSTHASCRLTKDYPALHCTTCYVGTAMQLTACEGIYSSSGQGNGCSCRHKHLIILESQMHGSKVPDPCDANHSNSVQFPATRFSFVPRGTADKVTNSSFTSCRIYSWTDIYSYDPCSCNASLTSHSI